MLLLFFLSPLSYFPKLLVSVSARQLMLLHFFTRATHSGQEGRKTGVTLETVKQETSIAIYLSKKSKLSDVSVHGDKINIFWALKRSLEPRTFNPDTKKRRLTKKDKNLSFCISQVSKFFPIFNT